MIQNKNIVASAFLLLCVSFSLLAQDTDNKTNEDFQGWGLLSAGYQWTGEFTEPGNSFGSIHGWGFQATSYGFKGDSNFGGSFMWSMGYPLSIDSEQGLKGDFSSLNISIFPGFAFRASPSEKITFFSSIGPEVLLQQTSWGKGDDLAASTSIGSLAVGVSLDLGMKIDVTETLYIGFGSRAGFDFLHDGSALTNVNLKNNSQYRAIRVSPYLGIGSKR